MLFRSEIETPQYRSAWYPYPKDFNATWKPGLVDAPEGHGFVMPTFSKED